jgi:serine/threonine-protein kinase
VNDDALFGAIAVQEGYLTQTQLDGAMGARNGAEVAQILLSLRLLSPEQVRTIQDIQRIRLAEADEAHDADARVHGDRNLLGCTGCETWYIVQGLIPGTKFVCRKCGRVLSVSAAPPPALQESPKQPGSGRRLGPYEILREIGRGSMSTVFEAFHPPSGKTVALKVLRTWDTPNPNPLRRFQQEARAISRLSHPNIVAIRDSGDVQGVYYIAMDLVRGETLDRLLAKRAIRLRDFVALLEKVALALHHAHQQGIIHRDLKPANILVDSAGEPRVTDFGLAKLDHASDKGGTHHGATLGTPFYMSPEQVSGDIAGTDARSDIYAMGVILYEALTGRHPYPGTSVMDVYRAVLAGSLAPPEKVNPDAPPPLAAVCRKALQREKARRYDSARQLAEDLRRWLEGKPVMAGQP